MSAPSIFCLAPNRGGADRIIHGLKAAQFTASEIGTLFFERNGEDDRARVRERATLSEAAAQSAGPIRGGLAGLSGISRLAVPGLGSFIAAGPIIQALRQVRNGAPGVAISRGLVHLGVAAADAARYAQRIKADGHILLSVQAVGPNRLLRARAVFAEANASDICDTADSPAPAAHRPAGTLLVGAAPLRR